MIGDLFDDYATFNRRRQQTALASFLIQICSLNVRLYLKLKTNSYFNPITGLNTWCIINVGERETVLYKLCSPCIELLDHFQGEKSKVSSLFMARQAISNVRPRRLHKGKENS